MEIHLLRAMTPDELREERCAICAISFRTESILAMSRDGSVCLACITYLGERNPRRFPSRGEYEAARNTFPTPIWSSEEEADEALEHARGVMIREMF